MRVTLCVTLSFFLISHASIRFPTSSASPLPSTHEMITVQCNNAKACPVNPNIVLLDGHNRPRGRDRTTTSYDALVATFNKDQYPYPTVTSTTKRSRTRARQSSTNVDAEMASTTTAPKTLLVTTSSPSAQSSSVQQATLSPLRPLYDMGRSSMQILSSKSQSSPLPWVLGIFIPCILAVLLCLAIRRSQRRKKQAALHSVVTSDSHSSEASGTKTELPSEEVGLGIRFEGCYNQSAMPTLPPVSIQSLNMEMGESEVKSQGHQLQEMVDRFELKYAVFPTRNELCHYVFPSTAAAVEREVQAAKRIDSNPAGLYSSFSSTRILTATRSLNHPSGRTVPREIGSRIHNVQKRRFSPVGEVLYSTGGAGDPLETVHEELSVEEVSNSPKAAYKGGDGEFAAGPRNEHVPLTSSNSYVSSSPVGLRARRKSSPLIPEVTFHDVDHSPVPIDFPSVAPLQINKTKQLSPNHRRSATKSGLFGWTSGLGTILPLAEVSSAADEEERKFTEFVKGLVWNVNAQKRSRRIQASLSTNGFERHARVSHSGAIDGGVPRAAGKQEGGVEYTGYPILLPPPSVGAALSDFSLSSSTLASDMPSSESRFSIGIAL